MQMMKLRGRGLPKHQTSSKTVTSNQTSQWRMLVRGRCRQSSSVNLMKLLQLLLLKMQLVLLLLGWLLWLLLLLLLRLMSLGRMLLLLMTICRIPIMLLMGCRHQVVGGGSWSQTFLLRSICQVWMGWGLGCQSGKIIQLLVMRRMWMGSQKMMICLA